MDFSRHAAGAALAVLFAIATATSTFAGPPPIQTFYVPLPEEEILAGYRAINGALGDTTIHTVIAVTSAADGTTIYYDHWEDGYETDIANPVQASTLFIGDGIFANGAPPGCLADACDVVNSGDVLIFINDVPADPRDPAVTLFDGRDKIASTRLVAVTQAAWPVPTGTVLAGAIEVFSTNDWGISYEAPGGEGVSAMFEDSRFIIMSQFDGTIVRVDIDDDGIDDIVQPLDEGETLTVDGVLMGTRVNSNIPVQTNFITGDVGSNYEARWYAMVPRSRWSSRYVAPVGTTLASNPAVVILYNPHGTALDVNVTTTGGTSTVTVPPGGQFRFTMPLGSGALFQSADSREFFAIAAIDDEGQAYDWGHTLLPLSSLAPTVKVGWAPGSAGAENSSPVWITAQNATILNVDWNDDGTVDTTVSIGALESVQLRDPDGDQTGARIFTTDGTLLSAAWGEDPVGASPGSPALDLGTTVLPLPDVFILKDSTLADDVNMNGLLDPGDSLLYSLFVLNTGIADADDVIVTDMPETYTSYVTGTTTIDLVAYPDDAAPSTPFPLDETGINLGTLVPGESHTIRYERRVGDPLPSPQQPIINNAQVSIAAGTTSSSTEVTVVVIPQFGATKVSDLGGPALPGEELDYTITITNSSPFTQTTITVDDALPAGTSYVPESTVVTLAPTTGNYRDSFNAVSYSNSDGTRVWSTDWIETGDGGGGAGGGDLQVTSDQGANRLRVRDDSNSVERGADLSPFTTATLSLVYRRDDIDGGEAVFLEISANGVSGWTNLATYGPGTDAGYVAASYPIPAGFLTANMRLRFRTPSGGMDNGDTVYFDEVDITGSGGGGVLTNQAGAPNPLVDGDPPTLVVAADAIDLAPGATMTVQYRVVVDDPLLPFLPNIINEAYIDSNESFSPTLVTRLDPVAPGSVVGDRVWLDVDGDGVQDIGENGLPNVRVELFEDPDGTPANGDEFSRGVVLTDLNGNYRFDSVYPPAAGSYYVEVDASSLPPGLVASPGNNNGRGPSLVVTGSDTLLDNDFGYTTAPGTAVIGDRIWSDADGDGVQDPGELGIGGVTIDLVGPGTDGLFGTVDDVVVATTTTSAAGSYLFVGVLPGDYRVDVTDTASALAGFVLTAGPEPSLPITVAAGDVDVSRDFGYQNPSAFTVTDSFWEDEDGDGIRDPGEAGIPGVTANLLDGSGNVVATTTTDASGNLVFSGVPDGSYTVVITDTGGVLTNMTTTTAASQAGQLAVVVSGGNVANESFGYRNLGTIGEVVWSDADGDGVRDPNEAGIGGVTLDLVMAGLDGRFGTGDDFVVATTTTTADGNYRFNAVARGYYQVQVTDTGNVLNGFVVTGDPDALIDGVGDVPLLTGAIDLTMNFGYQNAAAADVSGTVFDDTDQDGTQDGGEGGIAGVSLDLVDAGPDGSYGTIDDLVVATAVTDGNGDYTFPDVPDGDYQVVVTDSGNALNGYALTSGIDRLTVNVSAAPITNVDFGYVRAPGTASIGTNVWLDANRNGVRNPSEDGIPNVVVQLFTPGPDGIIGNGDDVLVATTTTDSLGNYVFTGLFAGDYYVDLDATTLPPGLAPTTGTADPTGLIQLSDGEANRDANFGYASTPGTQAAGDTVFYDADGDGFQDLGEVGIAGVPVQVNGPSGTFNVVTDSAGFWLVAGLAPGSYTATISPPLGYSGTTSIPFTLLAGLDFLRADFPLIAPAGATANIGDLVFFDSDGDGVRDAGEPGISGVTLRLLDGSGNTVATTVTAPGGGYDFVGVAPGSYTVEVTDIGGALAGLNLSAGANPTATILVAGGDDFNVADFGYASSGGTGAIGGFIWFDGNGDGFADASETGIQGVTLNLYVDVNGNGVLDPGVDNLVRTAETDVIGEYQMNGLPPGDYLVDVTDTRGVVTGFAKTSGAAGVDNNSQSDPYPVTLAAGSSDFTADFGYQPAGTSSILGTTFLDVAADGLFNGTDTGVRDVVVYLYRDLDGDGVLDATEPRIGTSLSDGNGDYDFPNLPDDAFIVAVDVTGTALASSFQTTQFFTAGVEPVTLAGADSTDHDFGFNVAATRVTLSRFDATLESGDVVVEWETSSELGSLGFYLFRWSAEQGTLVQVNDEILPALGSPTGGEYRLVDRTAPRRAALTYRLFEAEEGGGRRYYGPFTVTPRLSRDARPMQEKFERRRRRVPESIAERFGRARHRRRAAASEAAREHAFKHSERGAAGRPALKLVTDGRGVYFVPVTDIAEALSVHPMRAVGLSRRGGLSLTNRGESVAWLAAADGSGIYFFAESFESMYTDENVYWLELGRGAFMSRLPAPPALDGPSFYRHSTHMERDAFGATVASTEPDRDFWYWTSLIASLSGWRTGSYTVETSAVAAGITPARLTVELYGATTTAHRVRVRVNAVEVGEGSFSGVTRHRFDLLFDASLLDEGSNTVEVEAVLESGVAFDVVYVDSFELDYPRRLEPIADGLGFTASRDGAVALGGFAVEPVTALDVTDARHPRLLSDVVSEPGGVRFHVEEGSSYFAFSPSAVRSPIAKQVASLTSLRDGRADYLVITPEALADAAAELAARRRGQGFESEVVTLETIDDEFGSGLPSPHNIRRFLVHALTSWQTKPRFAVLVGRGTFDYKDAMGHGDNLVPPLMTATPYGLYASDVRIADAVGDDGVPDIMLGRIPVLSDDELLAYIDKLAAFEGGGLGEALFLADNADGAGNFTADSDALLQLLPAGVTAHRDYLSEHSTTEARRILFDRLASGVGFVNYVGHGGIDRFADEGLLVTADVAGLENATTPVMASLTCTTGRFEFPGYPSLAESLTIQNAGGAVAMWAPSGLSHHLDAMVLNRAFVEALYDEETEYVGEAVRRALEVYSQEGQMDFMRFIYNFFGDPATRLR